jgi:ribosomal-protein-alanine N-acetyltransferase
MLLVNIIETKRLILRPFTSADAADNYRIYSDPETMEYMGQGPDSVEAEREQIERHITDYYEKRGFGFWAVGLKENNRLIGRCGLLYQQVEDRFEIEVSYLLDRNFWGRGLATEAAREVVRVGFERYEFSRIIALIMPENRASIGVAEKIGMRYEQDVNYKQFGKVAMYVLSTEQFADQQAV